MNIGERVTIGGRTMLRPGFSLVGLEGIVAPSIPGAPAGCTTVLIDWKSRGYDDDDLPLLINVPTEHLQPADSTKSDSTNAASQLDSRTKKPRAVLGFVRPDAVEPDETAPKTRDEAPPIAPLSEAEDSTPQAEERPRLRLI